MWFVVRTIAGPRVRSMYLRYGTPGMQRYWIREDAEAEARRLLAVEERLALQCEREIRKELPSPSVCMPA